MFYEKVVLKYFAIFSGKTPVLECFPVSIAKFLRTPILKNICEWLLLFFTIFDIKFQLTGVSKPLELTINAKFEFVYYHFQSKAFA